VRDDRETRGLAGGIENRRAGDEDLDAAAVLALTRRFEVLGLARVRACAKLFEHLGTAGERHQHRHVAPDHLVGAVAEEPLGRGIPACDRKVGRFAVDRVARRAADRGEQRAFLFAAFLLADVAHADDHAAHGAVVVLEHRGVQRHRNLFGGPGQQACFSFAHQLRFECSPHDFPDPFGLGKNRGECDAHQIVAPVTCKTPRLFVDIGQDEVRVGDEQRIRRKFDQAAAVLAFFGELVLDGALLGDVARHPEDARDRALARENRCIEGAQDLPAADRAQDEVKVGYRALSERRFDRGHGVLRLGEITVEAAADQDSLGHLGELRELFVGVGDAQVAVDHHHRVNRGLDKAAGVVARLAQVLFDFLEVRDVAPDSRAPDNRSARVSDGKSTDQGGEPGPVLALRALLEGYGLPGFQQAPVGLERARQLRWWNERLNPRPIASLAG